MCIRDRLERMIGFWLALPSTADAADAQTFIDRYVTFSEVNAEADLRQTATAVFLGKTLLLAEGYGECIPVSYTHLQAVQAGKGLQRAGQVRCAHLHPAHHRGELRHRHDAELRKRKSDEKPSAHRAEGFLVRYSAVYRRPFFR